MESRVPHFACVWICFDRYGYHITKASYFICHDQNTIKKLFENLRNYDGKNNYPKTCGKFEISGIRDLTTGYDDSQPDKKAVSNVHFHQTLLFTFYYTVKSLPYIIAILGLTYFFLILYLFTFRERGREGER